MKKIVFDEEKCKGCELCVHMCPKSIIKISEEKRNLKGFKIAKVKEEKCIRCGRCAIVCPDTVIEVFET